MSRSEWNTFGTRLTLLSTSARKAFSRLAKTAGMTALALIALAPGNLFADSPAVSRTLVLGDGRSVYRLSSSVDVLEDPGKQLSIEDVTRPPLSGQFRPNHEETLTLGMTRSTWWLRFTVVDSSMHAGISRSPNWLLVVPWPYIRSIRFFGPVGGAGFTPGTACRLIGESSDTGYRSPFSQPATVPVFPLPRTLATPGTFYVQVENASAIYLPIEIRTRDAQLNQSTLRMLCIGLYAGGIIALALYTLFLFASLRDQRYAWYVCYIVFLGLFSLSFVGIARAYLFPERPEIAARMIFACMGCALLGAGMFARTFLGIQRHLPTTDGALLTVMGISLVITLLVPFLGLPMLGDTFCVLGVVFAFLFIGIGVEVSRKGFRPARFFLLAWVVYATSILLFLLIFRGVLVLPEWGFSVFQAGVGLHVVFLSFALADRIRILQHEREEARRSERRYQELALTDGLTGLYNARYFRSQIGREIEWAERSHLPLSLLMLDVDNFKRYNDTWGHPEGDHVLSQLGKTILAHTRESDMGCRYGGEEFAVILRGIGGREANEVAERIRSAFAAEPFTPGSDGTVSVTVSIGVAEHITGNPSSSLIDRADRVLYRAKHAGKNQVFRERAQ